MRILLVDDDEVFCQALKTNLHKNYYIVDTASDGQEGWELVEAGQYDLIVLDVIMPKLDGISFCHQLRKKGWQILVMLLTARGTSSDKIEGLDAGADDYVVKPIPLPELEARIRALLRRRSNDGSPVLQWGNLILDPNVNKFTYEGIILSLTAKEYSLLELFIRNTEKIHSQSSIINQLWSFEEEPPTGDTVRTLVKRLRRKLKLVGASDLIETVYGLGYRLNHKLSHSEKLSKIADNSKKDNYSEHLGKIVVNKDEKKSGYKFPKKSLINANSLNNADFYREIQSITCKEISRLEEALNNLKRNYSQDNSLEKARQITHKLIGSLGVFNLSEAITIIRELEIFFRDSCAKPGLIESQKYKHIGVQIQRLRSLIADADESQLCKQLSKTYNATQDNTNIRYRLLILDNDKSFVDNLVIRIANQDIQAIAEKDFQSAQDAIARVRPDIVLLDMSFHNNLQDMLDLLEKLSTKQPPVPTLVVSDNETTVNRIAIARRQVKGF